MGSIESNHQKGNLYVVATPIGNKDDITIRALQILSEVDFIAAEDTRITRRLLSHHHIKGHLISYHEHNETERTPLLIKKLTAGQSIALVTSAGTPSVSDPGYRLAREAVEKEIRVIPVPGASAVITALSAAGLPTDAFVFVGFLPKREGKRFKQLRALAKEPRTVVFYESPKRILTRLNEIISIFGDRYGVLTREMTKRHEEFIRGLLSEILRNLNDRPVIKGECTLLVSGSEQPKVVSSKAAKEELQQLLDTKEHPLSEIVRMVSKKYGLPRNAVYKKALQLKEKRN